MSDNTLWESFATYFVEPSHRSNDSKSGSHAPTEASLPRGSTGSTSQALKTHAIRLDEKKASTRAGFLRTLAELIGPRPANDADGRLPWRAEYEALSIVCLENDRLQQGEPRHFEGKPHAELRNYLHTSDGADYCLQNEIDLPREMKRQQANIERLVARGWHRDHAESYTLLFPLRSGLSADLDRATTEVRFPGCNYAMAEALFQTAFNQQAQRLDDAAKQKGKATAVAGAPRRLYKHLTGPNSLTEADGAWAGLNVPDRTGFRGLTSTALCIATDEPRALTTLGFRNRETSEDGEGIYQLIEGGDIVCFEGAENEEELMHQCVMIDEHNGALPANTLFRLKRVEEPGTWEVEGMSMPISTVLSPAKTDRKAKAKAVTKARTSADLRRDSAEAEKALVPGQVKPNCRLFVVSCTFKRPTEVGDEGRTYLTGKMSGAVNTLVYGSRETYINGLDDILENPILTMEQEFNRPQKSFTDWRGEVHDPAALWKYVTGVARRKEDAHQGVRDENNDGMTPSDFKARANLHIKQMRAQIIHRRQGDESKAMGFDPELLLLSEGDALLSLEEVLAVRLYSGPAFQPINAFLREIGKLTGEFRRHMARHPELTFAATTRHLCRAIRKLADVTRDEGVRRLYRGVRGELPPAFWDKDGLGMISAVDNGFMSTSKKERTPISYMQGEFNVLWELDASDPSDDAYHCGADISMLSQFQHEDEVLFPPNTMLIVRPAPLSSIAGPKFSIGTKVYVQRSNGEETLGTVHEYHARRQQYTIALPGGVNKFAYESMMRPADPNWKPADPKAAAAAAATTDKTKEFSTKQSREIARKELSTHEYDHKSGNAWMRVHVRPCFV